MGQECTTDSHATPGAVVGLRAMSQKGGGWRRAERGRGGVGGWTLSHSSLGWGLFRAGNMSLPGLRGKVVDLSQVLHRRAFMGVCQLDPHSQLLLKNIDNE